MPDCVVILSFFTMLLAPCVVALRASLKTDFIPAAMNQLPGGWTRSIPPPR